MSSREQALDQTRRMREQAERTVEELKAALAECEATLAADKRTDVVRRVKGKSSLEQAIEDARRMVEVLKRAEAELQAGTSSPIETEQKPETDPTASSGPGPSAIAEPKSISTTPWRETREDAEETPLAGVIGPISVRRGLTATSRRAAVLLGGTRP